MSEEEEWTENQLFEYGDTYDILNQPEDKIYRHVTDWYLTRMNSKLNYRVALPKWKEDLLQQKESSNRYVLKGRLLPKEGSGAEPLKFSLDYFYNWDIDKATDDLRGIWVETEEAWYKLKQPSKESPKFKIKIPGYQESIDKTLFAHLPDQAHLHLELRAKLGLISNLSDIFDESDPESVAYVKEMVDKKPGDLHRDLCPSQDFLDEFPDRAKEPFDLQLLRNVPDFVKSCLVNPETFLNDSSTFIRSLKNPTKKVFTPEEYEESAKLAEKRGARLPWGDRIKDAELVDPLWLYKARLDRAAKKVRQKIELQSVAIEPQQKTQEDSAADEKNLLANIGMKDEKELKDATVSLMEFSPERMKDALNTCSLFIKIGTSEYPVSLPDLKSAKPEFTDPESLPELTERMANEQLKTFESKLLIAIAFMNSVCISPDKKRAKKFFNKFKKGLKILFNSWTSNSITEIMKIQELPADGLAFELLVEIASLIFKCDLVDKMSKLDTMKQKTGTDWRNVLTEMTEDSKYKIAEKCKPGIKGRLIMACNKARGRLMALPVDDTDEKEEKGGRTSKTDTRIKSFPTKPIAGRGSTTSEKSRVDPAEEEKKRREKENRERRKKLLMSSVEKHFYMARQTGECAVLGDISQPSNLEGWGQRIEPYSGWGNSHGNSAWTSDLTSSHPSDPSAWGDKSSSAYSTVQEGWGDDREASGWGSQPKTAQSGSHKGWGDDDSKAFGWGSQSKLSHPANQNDPEEGIARSKAQPALQEGWGNNSNGSGWDSTKSEKGWGQLDEGSGWSLCPKQKTERSQGDIGSLGSQDGKKQAAGKDREENKGAEHDRLSSFSSGRSSPNRSCFGAKSWKGWGKGGSIASRNSDTTKEASVWTKGSVSEMHAPDNSKMPEASSTASDVDPWKSSGSTAVRPKRGHALDNRTEENRSKLPRTENIAPDSSGVSGRGRGRGMTLPAWMTTGDNGQTIGSAASATRQRHIAGGAGLGQGRGRSMTLPAWMTRDVGQVENEGQGHAIGANEGGRQ